MITDRTLCLCDMIEWLMIIMIPSIPTYGTCKFRGPHAATKLQVLPRSSEHRLLLSPFFLPSVLIDVASLIMYSEVQSSFSYVGTPTAASQRPSDLSMTLTPLRALMGVTATFDLEILIHSRMSGPQVTWSCNGRTHVVSLTGMDWWTDILSHISLSLLSSVSRPTQNNRDVSRSLVLHAYRRRQDKTANKYGVDLTENHTKLQW